MPDRPDSDRLLDILDEIAIIEKALRGLSYEEFLADEVKRHAVLHALQTIGEAANYISDATLAKMPDAPWAQIRGMRNRIVHGYFGIDSLAVWRTATEETPALRQTISQSGLT
ncbi:MAG TPA: DUF86 domain-containing protein [Caulobacterales bacterium]|nr:DUF86 domain-containing protein [Caulobacterales bacterium]